MPHFMDQSNSVFTGTIFLPHIYPLEQNCGCWSYFANEKKNYQRLKRLGWGRKWIILMDSITYIYLKSISVFRSDHKLLSNTLSNLDSGQRP